MVQVGVGAVVAAGTLLSELDLQALDHTVLLLQLFGQPDEGDEEEEEEEDLGGVSRKKRRAGLDFCMLGVQLVLVSVNRTLLCWGTFYQSFIFAVTGLILRNSRHVQSLL